MDHRVRSPQKAAIPGHDRDRIGRRALESRRYLPLVSLASDGRIAEAAFAIALEKKADRSIAQPAVAVVEQDLLLFYGQS